MGCRKKLAKNYENVSDSEIDKLVSELEKLDEKHADKVSELAELKAAQK